MQFKRLQREERERERDISISASGELWNVQNLLCSQSLDANYGKQAVKWLGILPANHNRGGSQG